MRHLLHKTLSILLALLTACAFVDVPGAPLRAEDGRTLFPGEDSETETVTVR